MDGVGSRCCFFFFCRVMQSSLTIVQLYIHTLLQLVCFDYVFFFLLPMLFSLSGGGRPGLILLSEHMKGRVLRVCRLWGHAVALHARWGSRREPQEEQLYLSMWGACDMRPSSKTTPRHASIWLDLTYTWTLFNDKHGTAPSLPEGMREGNGFLLTAQEWMELRCCL